MRRMCRLAGILILVFSFSGIEAQHASETFGRNRIQYKNFDWKYLSSENFDVYFYRVEAYISLKNYSSAILDLNHLININPKYSNTYFKRGNVHITLNNLDNAIADYTQAIEVALNNFDNPIRHLRKLNMRYPQPL